jgi:hypothetical protein
MGFDMVFRKTERASALFQTAAVGTLQAGSQALVGAPLPAA